MQLVHYLQKKSDTVLNNARLQHILMFHLVCP